ncbi:MAG: hypothetical protein ACLVJN_06225 [Streptococcus parasanguinis]
MGNIIEEYIPDAKNINSGSVSASKLAVGELSFKSFEITINQAISKEELNRLKGVLW